MKTSYGIAIAVAVALALVFLFFGTSLFTLFSTPATMPADDTTNALPTDLTIADVTPGDGQAAKAGDTITVNYVGALSDGTVFDSSQSHGQPYTFVLGAGTVIPGWDQGLVGMKVGGTRQLIIPPSLGYGPNDYGPIPGNSTLIFQVQLVKIGE